MHISNIKGSEKICKKKTFQLLFPKLIWLLALMCICICVCVCVGGGERERGRDAYWHLHILTNLILFCFLLLSHEFFWQSALVMGNCPLIFQPWCLGIPQKQDQDSERENLSWKGGMNLQAHDCCGLPNKILHTSSPQNQIYSWSIGCFLVFASCGVWFVESW